MKRTLLVIVIATSLVRAQQNTPVFRASADLVVVEAQVVDGNSKPIEGLRADQFDVRIDGKQRAVLSAEFSQTTTQVSRTGGAQTTAVTATPQDGRVLVIGIDQGSFPSSARASAREAATRIVNRAAPEDYVGMIAFPGSIEIAPTRDRASLVEGIKKIAGLRVEAVSSRFSISAREAIALKSREPVTTQEILRRICKSEFDQTRTREVFQVGGDIAETLEQQAQLSLSGLHGVVDAMASLPGRKTLVVVSAGLPLSSRPGSALNIVSETEWLARKTAAANINLYVFYMNVHFLRYFSAEYGKTNNTIFEDISMFGAGLENFADNAGGGFFQVEVDSDPFVDRVLRETSASYLIGIQTDEALRDGKEHFVRVSVKIKGATVRYRRIVVVPRGGG